ncbi:MAG: hypothetical protein US86_C0002G0089 [Candidatus Daviesbacteria bacterium GW2011_GWA2_38_24]|uniref:Uncharacterized protein n=1 Tax=Candidatus Daviesbacteria bacterium GW2011_GWA2_38_24 TaxID=1618422 RepID=A0A0G0JJF2_9BACT|nr:MAG: hypothetical protein US86_C0002G0089 [Candidatus Daviesbacteria bacterium GW2011_GWA2_38_24]KKQ79830.1 MAG: hypothetical protein UT01_C0027G0015 [Candidatus Daviesbacteria bacterium GW2011_GWA1_38_7]OGE22979.1 MAG: hypothetical protein A2688_03245 [Candidatus Daviesbacteria bacterium RIFCSPHIGHO2_01_FULL_38_8]
MKDREKQTSFEELTNQSPTYREWFIAFLLLPVTLQKLAQGIGQIAEEMRYHRRIYQHLANLDEVGRDLNTGLYRFFGGRVSYKRPDPVTSNPNSK